MGVPIVLLLVAISGGAAPSDAAFPGRNGLIAFASSRSPLLSGEVFAVDIRTGRRSNVSRNWVTEVTPVRSPTGRTVATVGDDGVYVMSLDGHHRRRVARIAGHAPFLASQLAWSPDGRRIAYVLARGGAGPRIFVVAAKGGAPSSAGRCASSDSNCFAWAPDGNRLAVLRNERDLYVVGVGTGRARRIARNAFYPAWSPDGRWIAYSSRGLVLVRPSGRSRRRLSPLNGPFAWSPDSAAIAVNSGGNVYRVSTRGKKPRRRLGSAYSESGLIWSPNGRWIAVIGSGRSPNHFFEVLSTTSRLRKRLRSAFGQADASSPSWSPDGRRLYYGMKLDEFGAPYDVYTARADGTGLRRLTSGEQPRWSPDGMRIAYICGSSRRSLCVISRTGAARRRVIGGVDGGGLSWSPDGTSLAFVHDGNVHVVSADGTGLRPVTQTPGTDRYSAFDPAWSPDGRLIAYTHHRRFSDDRFNPCCTETLTVVDVDGGEPRELKVNYLVAYYLRPAWSPDGTRIALVDQEGDDFCHEGVDGTECPPSHLFLLSVKGGATVPVGRFDDRSQFDPAWSPDGKSLAFEQHGEIATVGVDGRKRRRLLGARGARGLEKQPDWQPRCTLYGTSRADRLVGTAGRDVICALGGDDTVEALAGDDVVIGGDGNDRIDGGTGEDRLFGAFGDDAIDAQDGAPDVVDGGPGLDSATADAVDAQRLIP
jgi:Tol biopolymer transport system component